MHEILEIHLENDEILDGSSISHPFQCQYAAFRWIGEIQTPYMQCKWTVCLHYASHLLWQHEIWRWKATQKTSKFLVYIHMFTSKHYTNSNQGLTMPSHMTQKMTYYFLTSRWRTAVLNENCQIWAKQRKRWWAKESIQKSLQPWWDIL